MITCIKHPKYSPAGKSNPTLTCKTCCILYANHIKQLSEHQTVEQWLEAKTKRNK